MQTALVKHRAGWLQVANGFTHGSTLPPLKRAVVMGLTLLIGGTIFCRIAQASTLPQTITPQTITITQTTGQAIAQVQGRIEGNSSIPLYPRAGRSTVLRDGDRYYTPSDRPRYDQRIEIGEIEDSILIDPVIINSTIEDSTLINPIIISDPWRINSPWRTNNLGRINPLGQPSLQPLRLRPPRCTILQPYRAACQ